MNQRITALIVAGVLQLANSSAVLAESSSGAAAFVAPQVAFMLPINGTLRNATPGTTKFQVLDPLPEGSNGQPPKSEPLQGGVSLSAPNVVPNLEDGPIIIDNDEAVVKDIINENY